LNKINSFFTPFFGLLSRIFVLKLWISQKGKQTNFLWKKASLFFQHFAWNALCIYNNLRHLESWKFEFQLRTMYLSRIRPIFSIGGLRVLGLGPEPDPLQMGFFVNFWTYILRKLGLLGSIPWKMVFAPNLELPGNRPNSRVQIFPPEYLGTNALQKNGVIGTFVCLIESVSLHGYTLVYPGIGISGWPSQQ
jgi:hypothetical protein